MPARPACSCRRLPIKGLRSAGRRSDERCVRRGPGSAPRRHAWSTGLTCRSPEEGLSEPESTLGCIAQLAMSHDDTDGEPGIEGIPILPMIMGYTGTPTIPARTATGWTRRVCRVERASLRLTCEASDRVPRFSRFEISRQRPVRAVQHGDTLTSANLGREKGVRRHRARQRYAITTGRTARNSGAAVAKEDAFLSSSEVLTTPVSRSNS